MSNVTSAVGSSHACRVAQWPNDPAELRLYPGRHRDRYHNESRARNVPCQHPMEGDRGTDDPSRHRYGHSRQRLRSRTNPAINLSRLIPDEALAATTHEGRPSMQERLLAEIPDGHGVLVTEADGTLVGFSNLTVTRDAANDGQAFELCTICVHPTPQGCGAGSTLRLASEAAMRDAGATIAELWVLDGHERAQRFYWKHRRERDGATRDDVLFRCTRPGGPLSQAAPKRRQRVTARASPSRRASAARISGVSPSCVRDGLSVEGRPAKYRRWRSRPGRTQTGARSGHRHQVYRHG